MEHPPAPPELVDISVADGTATFTFLGLSFTSDSNTGEASLKAFAPPNPSRPCGSILTALSSAGQTILYGALSADTPPCFPLSHPSPPTYFTGRRCGCLDGNSVAGDGCDASCQVEKCFECTGDPSVCVPSAEGAACDDGSACTAGETCSSGACVGGHPSSPCIDLGGNWAFHVVTPIFEELGYPPADVPAFFTQVNDSLELRFSPSSAAVLTGHIDVDTGEFHLRRTPHPTYLPCYATTISGQAADGRALAATKLEYVVPGIGRCLGYLAEVTGSRCGIGTLGPGKQCDDGNLTSGDGCDGSCFVEPCFACAGEPSICAPSDATPCDDGDACTIGDVCQTGSCVAGPALACGPCLACAPNGTCEAAPLDTCRQPTDTRRTLLMLKNRGSDGEYEVTWRWQGGSATPPRDQVDSAPDQDYTLCVYDESGPTPALLFRATAPAGGTCGDAPCWKSIAGRGSSYRDPENSPDGIRSLGMGWGRRGSARAVLRGKGPMLSGRPYGFPDLPLPLPLRTQLQGENGACFEAYFADTGVKSDDRAGKRFLARPRTAD